MYLSIKQLQFNKEIMGQSYEIKPNQSRYFHKTQKFVLIDELSFCFEWYGNVYSKIGVKNRFEINNDSPKTAVKRLIKEYGLSG